MSKETINKNIDELTEFYNENYHGNRHGNLLGDDEYFWARAKTSQHFYFSDHAINTMSVLDFGGGIGQTTAGLPNSTVYDLSREARDACKKREIDTFDSIDNIPRSHYDMVICRHALEHVPNPLETLETMRSLLKIGGELFLVLPCEGHYLCSHNPEMLNYHLFAWNFRCINNLLHLSGYNVIENRKFYVLGYRSLLPIRRMLGESAYRFGLKIVGRIKNNSEIIIRATRRT